MTPIPDAVVIAAIELVLKPLGTSLRHYEVRHKTAALEAMRGLLMAERERAASITDAANAHYAREQASAKAKKSRIEAHDFESMRFATAGLGDAIRKGAV